MHFHQQLTLWLKADPLRCQALRQAAALGLPDWCIAAGFVRNLVWDRLHGFTRPTPLTDIDLIYFNTEDISEEADRALEQRLMQDSDLPWSVKNQARMHVRNGDVPYLNTLDAMSCWPEPETAVGVRLEPDLAFISPFPLENLRDLQITLNPKRPKISDFEARVAEKKWLEIWPKLQVNREGDDE
ncbi:nucleotidyltransferase family protein [Iodobacter sp. HSC-16F04]|uniref:Nucleotidyltransferase family protein n=1 Tax=Iodobacter violaceini TaxID=3044271 RepID=A0ABX0KRF2_9NEIS|nr:nucleotidyltransferase family protein [Iodobacter violacea]NHQ85027.1 nucleotidyltransferase family protein [Iodobacter violacea]